MPTQCESDIIPVPIMRNMAVTKPPVPERNAELIMKVGGKRIPPPPPPRTSSRSPLASPTSPNVPQTMPTVTEQDNKELLSNANNADSSGENSSGNESGNDNVQRQVALEMRHQELLKKQKMLQEQYQRLQQMSKIPSMDMTASGAMDPNLIPLKKMGSESNIQQKILALSLTNQSNNTNANSNNDNANGGNTPANTGSTNSNSNEKQINNKIIHSNATSTTKQVYETEIL